MRIFYLLLVGISISLTTAATSSASSSSSSNVKSKSSKLIASSATPTKPTKKTTKPTKVTSENREKRTLYDFGNPGYSFGERQSYVEEARAYYPQDNYYNGQNQYSSFGQERSLNHLPTDFGASYSPYPQYLEAPEPIIEIIIKDSNETVPTIALPQPIVTKKKKEKVHVYYVKYKKDKNNKLHLESPIASLNNDEENEDGASEEEEIIHYPSVVTPIPPIKTTTLRTVIHPDSEKFHSNSGIHVSFGSEDKTQSGHILEENDSESVQREVVALPHPVSLAQKSEQQQANVRADFSGTSNGRSQTNYQYTGFNQQSSPAAPPIFYQSYQQLPSLQAEQVFRPHHNHQQQQQQTHEQQQQQTHQQYFQQQQQPTHQQHFQLQQQQQNFKHQLQAQQQHYQQQTFQQTQTPSKLFQQKLTYNPQPQYQPQAQTIYRKPPTAAPATSKPQIQKQSQSQYPHQPFHYQQYNQYFQQSPPQVPSQSHKESLSQLQPSVSPVQKKPTFFPTVPPKAQELALHQNPPVSYQPVKFRPNPTPTSSKPIPIPVKLENSHYNKQSHLQQHQQQQQFSYNRQQFGPPSTLSASNSNFQNHQLVDQNPPQPQEPNFYKPQFQTNSHKQPQKIQPQSQANYPNINTKNQSQSSSSSAQSAGLSSLHKYFDVRPSKETELLKAIPKFEQHITETVNHQNPVQRQQFDGVYQHYPYSSHNQVIHDIPAPNLGPTQAPKVSHSVQPTFQVSSSPTVETAFGGHYITDSNSQQFSNFVTTPQSTANHYISSTPAPKYAQSSDGQQIQIVTPMPPTIFQNSNNQYHSSQFTSHRSQPQIIPNSQPIQTNTQYIQQPRNQQSRNQASASTSEQELSKFSVSTLHSDVFRELDQRKNSFHQEQKLQQDQQLRLQNRDHNAHIQSKIAEKTPSSTAAPSSTVAPTQTSAKASQSSLQLPEEVPDDLRQQLLSSGILDNADISVLDYDKVGDIPLENLPAEHLQHFYGAGGGAQISGSHKVLTVVKPNGDSVNLHEKSLHQIKESNTLPHRQNVDLKVVRFDADSDKSVTNKFIKTDATVLPPVDLTDRQYNRYLPLKINGAQFPIPDVEELRGKKIASVVVLAAVDTTQTIDGVGSEDERTERDAATTDSKEVKFIGGDVIKQLVKKPTKENFKRWLEKESRTDVEMQSVVLLVTRTPRDNEHEIFMYDITTGVVNKLNGELSNAFVNVAEENASLEDLENASMLDPSFLETMLSNKSNRGEV